MNKADQRLIAEALRKSRPIDLYINEAARKAWYRTVTDVANAIRDKHPRFDATTFFDICGVPT